MIIDQIQIKNFRSFEDCTVNAGNILAVVGRNNSGKSNLLRAVRLFMEASKKLLDEDCFHHHNTSDPITIRVRFKDLNEWEREEFDSWLYDEDTLIVERRFESTGEGSYNIERVAITREPSPEWLKENAINGKRIEEWWERKEDLVVAGLDFGSTLGTSRPQVGEWKEAAEEFVNEHREEVDFEDVERDNPRGYKGVLRGALPEFILVPAVRDVSEASKITKSSPFGQLINSVLKEIAEEKKQAVQEKIDEVNALLNRGDERLEVIGQIEEQLNELAQDLADIDVEIAMETPKLEDVLGTANIYADDGARTAIENKGHGLQRAMIFTILRAYANMTADGNGSSRSTIFAFEEPEIYQHPQSQRTLLSVFRDIARAGDQVIYTTHSSHFVEVSRFDEVCIMRRKKRRGSHCSSPAQLSMEQMLEDLKERKGVEGTIQGMREQYANAFHSGMGEGFFADKVVLTEGQSEKYVLSIYARLLGYDFDRNNVALMHGWGKGQLDRHLRIFSGLGIPTYLIFDADGKVDDKTRELAGMMGHDLSDSNHVQNTIAERFAIWENDLEDVLKDEIEKYEVWASDVDEKWGEVGKPLRHRYMAIQIERHVDEAGAEPAEIVPPSIRDVIDRIREMSGPVNVLEESQ